MRYGQVRATDDDIAAFDELEPEPTPILPRRIALEPDKVERGLAHLVLSLIELVRRLIEKQALRRIEGGSLTPEQIENLGLTLARLEDQMQQLKATFKLDDLNLDLGPLGKLVD